MNLREKAREILDAQGTTDQMRAAFADSAHQSTEAVIEGMEEASGTDLTSARTRAAVRVEKLAELAGANFEDMLEDMVDAMLEVYTPEEIQGIYSWMTSEIGQAVSAKALDFFQATNAIGAAWAKKLQETA